jgi:hypothetical protein
MRDPNTLIPSFAALQDSGICLNNMQVREVLVLVHQEDGEIVEAIRINLYKPETPDGKPNSRFDALVEPRHRNSLLIEETAFAALLKAGIIAPPHYWEGMRPVCRMLNFDSAI